MKNKTLIFILVLTGLLILSGYAIFRLYSINEQNKASLPYLVAGESINYFNLLDDNAQTVDLSVLNDTRPSLVFIFSRPCSPCNKNIVYWKKMAKLLHGEVNVYGIILSDASKAFSFAEEVNLNFKLYIPENLTAFIDAMRLRMNLSQTILYHRGGVQRVKMGELNGKEATEFIKAVRNVS